jgi:HEAT repeat protein
MPRPRFHSAPLALLLVALPLAAAPPSEDPVRDARSRDPLVRLEAARALSGEQEKDAVRALRKLLEDDDWEVALEAVRSLGAGPVEAALGDLVELACEGPVRRLRLAAARAAGRIDAAGAAALLEKRLKGEEATAAAEALALVAASPGAEGLPSPSRRLERLLEDEEAGVRAAGARALVALAAGDRSTALRRLAAEGGPAALAAGLEEAALTPDPSQRAALEELLRRPALLDVLERRAVRALAATLGGATEGGELVRELCAAPEAPVAQRGLLLAMELRPGGTPDLVAATGPARTHADPGVRALAARFLAGGAPADALDAARALAGDAEPRVRTAARRAALTLDPATGPGGRAWAVAELERAATPDERRALVVALAVPEAGEDPGAVSALVLALEDPSWEVAACAAVSLGRTRSADGVRALTALTASEDWRLRGAAVVGLSKSLDRGALAPIAERVDDPEPSVARTAHAALTGLASGDPVEATARAWKAWLVENGGRVRLDDPAERRARRERYGYGTPAEEIYRGLDVAVLESRGDRMQDVLGRLGIRHRVTASSRVAPDGLDAGGVFVSNCTGELEAGDLERLRWFLLVGGHLCGSCWALTETVGRVAPGYLERLPTRDEVLDQVEAGPCAADSPYLEGVFGEAVVPVYHLEGAHLLRVQRPEAVEVLVDSPVCAERWGGGTLAAWFRHGHGTVLVSANHFRAQGLEEVNGLSSPEERRAYAMDHMGLGFEYLRETAGEKFWTSTPRAAAEVHDLSVFRIVTNFVRLRRLEGL